MKRYSEDIKKQALESMKAIGVKRTGEEMGLSIQTLYKWRNDVKRLGGRPASTGKSAELLRVLKEDNTQEEKIRQLEIENAKLRQTIVRMKKAFIEMIE
ncbi:MAG: transposase [Clostridia bacterium]|nr:transposase [Clostridia bacterium]